MPLRKLNPDELDSTDKLIHAIETKDRRFRLFQTLFMVGTFIALIIIISAQQRTLDGVQSQLTQAKEVAAEQSKQSDTSQKTVLRRLDCLAVYFSQRNRTDLTISDIDKCTLDRNGTAQQFFTESPGKAPVTTPTEQQPQNLTPSTTPAQGSSANTGQGQTTPAPTNNPTTLDLPLVSTSPICLLKIVCVE